MRGLSAVVRFDELGAMRRPGRVERMTGKFHAFFCIVTLNIYDNPKKYEKDNLKSDDSCQFV